MGRMARSVTGCYVRTTSAALTRSGVNGTCRIRTPVASNTALAIAAATIVMVVSPAPVAGSSIRLINTVSIFGTLKPTGSER